MTPPTLKTERMEDGRRKLLAALSRSLLTKGVRPRSISVPAGFITDFSSIPQAFAWIVRWSKVDVAGVIHDFLYSRKGKMSRRDADEAWRLIALQGEHRANRVQAGLCWLALRLFGWLAWKKR